MTTVLLLKNGRQVSLTGLSDEHVLLEMRRIRPQDIVSVTHRFTSDRDRMASWANAVRLEHLWLARWN